MLAIDAITNVASAILKNPDIIDRIVIVWLGGNALHWPENKEFNLYQDVAAARIILSAEPHWCSFLLWRCIGGYDDRTGAGCLSEGKKPTL